MAIKRAFGDYQTPETFALRVCRYLKDIKSLDPSAVLEPTCGLGNLISAAKEVFSAQEYVGIELNPDYAQQCQLKLSDATVHVGNIFEMHTADLISHRKQILVLGNPPWVMTDTLSTLNSSNIPDKINLKNLKGIEAITGSGTFDICESIILKLINEFMGTNTIIAMLCKSTVARNVFIELKRNHVPFSECELCEFTTRPVFHVQAQACLLTISLIAAATAQTDAPCSVAAAPEAATTATVSSAATATATAATASTTVAASVAPPDYAVLRDLDDAQAKITAVMIYKNGKLSKAPASVVVEALAGATAASMASAADAAAAEVATTSMGKGTKKLVSSPRAYSGSARAPNAQREAVEDFEGVSCFEWRQGVKHDCSKIMELCKDENGAYINGLNEQVDIEPDLVFPLIKSSMFKSPIVSSFSRYVIVTQRKVRESTEHLQHDVPKTYAYLQEHLEYFMRRKSSVYKDAPAFSMFGVGEYSYYRYKVGISGFYKNPLFSVLMADDGRPVMTDDTSYFICMDSFDDAYTAMLLLNSIRVQAFLKSIAFVDAKRPYTKKVLSRIDFSKIVAAHSLADLKHTEQAFNLKPYITTIMYEHFQALCTASTKTPPPATASTKAPTAATASANTLAATASANTSAATDSSADTSELPLFA